MRDPVTNDRPQWRDTENEKRRRQTQAAREAKALKDARKIAVYGLEVVDTNSPGAQAVLKWRDAMLDDLGGQANLSAAKLLMIEHATVTALAIKRLDNLILQATGALVHSPGLHVAPFVMQRQALVDSFARQLTRLGLDRKHTKTLRGEWWEALDIRDEPTESAAEESEIR